MLAAATVQMSAAQTQTNAVPSALSPVPPMLQPTGPANNGLQDALRFNPNAVPAPSGPTIGPATTSVSRQAPPINQPMSRPMTEEEVAAGQRVVGFSGSGANMSQGLSLDRARQAEDAVDAIDDAAGSGFMTGHAAQTAVGLEAEAASELGRASRMSVASDVLGRVGTTLSVGSVGVDVVQGEYANAAQTVTEEAIDRGGCAAMGGNPALCGAWSAGLSVGQIIRENVTINGATLQDHVTDFWAWALLPSDAAIMEEAEARQRAYDAERASMRAQAQGEYSAVASSLQQQQAAHDAEQAALAAQRQAAASQQAQSSGGGSGFMDFLGTVAATTLQIGGAAAQSPMPSANDSSGAQCTPRTFNTHDTCHPNHDEDSHPGGCHCG
ncbi:hypothetical protein U91I_02384 [alpha proteobacterium U9-1i]|nr:hypothetical protein U91I_02384 [alpha proteobacterium U9-1i]